MSPVAAAGIQRQVPPSMMCRARAIARTVGFAAPSDHDFIDLGMSPLCQTHIAPDQLNQMEPFYPLHAYVCDPCFLVQLEEFVAPSEIFTDYAYLSSYSDSWVEHARRYTEKMRERFGLNSRSLVTEIASNDGYLLQHFVARQCSGVGGRAGSERGADCRKQGHTNYRRVLRRRYRGEDQAGFRCSPTCYLGNNVLAHVPDINDFVGGMKVLLKAGGVITMEFPHLMQLMRENQFDTIYHEHFSYLAFFVVERIFRHHGLRLFDVEELPTHGGSLRIYACHDDDGRHPTLPAVEELRAREMNEGLGELATYGHFEERVKEAKRAILEFPYRREAAGKADCRLWSPGKGEHAAQLLRHPHRFHRLHGRSQSAETGQVHAGHAHTDPRSRGDPGSAAGLRLHPAVESEGRDQRVDELCTRMGREVRRADSASVDSRMNYPKTGVGTNRHFPTDS